MVFFGKLKHRNSVQLGIKDYVRQHRCDPTMLYYTILYGTSINTCPSCDIMPKTSWKIAMPVGHVNSLTPGGFGCNVRYAIFTSVWLIYWAFLVKLPLCECPSQWEMTLHCNVISHWLDIYTKWSLGPNWWYINIGAGNGLVPSGTKPLPAPILN